MEQPPRSRRYPQWCSHRSRVSSLPRHGPPATEHPIGSRCPWSILLFDCAAQATLGADELVKALLLKARGQQVHGHADATGQAWSPVTASEIAGRQLTHLSASSAPTTCHSPRTTRTA